MPHGIVAAVTIFRVLHHHGDIVGDALVVFLRIGVFFIVLLLFSQSACKYTVFF